VTSPPAPLALDARSALRSPTFRRLTVAWGFTNFADSVLALILAVWVKDLTGSDSLGGLVFAALGAPALVSPLLGQVADRVSRRRMMTATYATGGATLLALFAVRSADDVWIVFLVTVVYSLVGFATTAAQSGLVRDMLPDAALAAANGRLTTIDQVFRLTMPLVGAGVYVATGPLPLVAAAVVAFALAAAVVSRIRLVETPPTSRDERAPFRSELTAGFRHLLTTPPLGGLTVALLVGCAAVGLLNASSFAVIDHGLGLGPQMLGPVSSIQGATAIVAGLTAARLVARWGSPRLMAVGLGAVALGVLPTLGSSLPGVLAGLGLVGLGMTWAIIGFVTERQVKTPPRLQGRVSSATNMLLNVPQLATTVLGAALLGLVDYRVLLGASALGIAAGAALALRAVVRPAGRAGTPRPGAGT
jgi:Na+/melibiose symporter-like transporter